MREDALRILRKLGLTDYESRAYLSLLKLGKATPRDVSNDSGVPYSKVYSILDELVEKGLAEYSGGRPKVYKALDPEKALRSYLMSEYQEKCELLDSLLSMLPMRPSVDYSGSWIVKNASGVFSKLVELIESARVEICSIAPHLAEPRASESQRRMKLGAIRRALERGVRARFIVERIPDLREQLEMFRNFVAISDNLSIKVVDRVLSSLAIFDSRDLLLSTPLAKERPFAIWIRDPDIVSQHMRLFEILWEEAEDLEIPD